MPLAPRQRFGIADVRDVAAAHLAAMSTPEPRASATSLLADGPTISWLGVATLLARALRRRSPRRLPTEEVPGEELPPLVIHNERAKAELGFAPAAGGGDDRGDCGGHGRARDAGVGSRRYLRHSCGCSRRLQQRWVKQERVERAERRCSWSILCAGRGSFLVY